MLENNLFDEIDSLVDLSAKPLNDKYLEGLQGRMTHPEKYYRFLYHLVLTKKPVLSLEIGLLHGLGSIHMAVAARNHNGHVIGLDRTTDFLWDIEIGKLENCSWIVGVSTLDSTLKMVRDVVDQYGKIGLVYQDSAHHYYESCEEFELYQQFLVDDCIWIVDDVTKDFQSPNAMGMLTIQVKKKFQRQYINKENVNTSPAQHVVDNIESVLPIIFQRTRNIKKPVAVNTI